KEKKVHSTEPVNAVAVEAKRNKIKPAQIEEQPIMKEPQQAPIAGVATEQPVVKEQQVPEPVVAEVTEQVTRPEIPVGAPEDEVLPGQPAHQKNRFIAAVVGPKPLILDELEAAVNEKVIIAKN